MGQRRVTISTVGLPEKIRKLAGLDRQYHLAVSLHAPTEELRERARADQREGRPGRRDGGGRRLLPEDAAGRLPIEYVLLGGVNDRPADAQALARLLAARQAHVNLIPYNPVAGLPFERPDARGGRAVRRDPPRPGGQRDGPQDQGAGHRRGLRPAPAPAGARVASRGRRSMTAVRTARWSRQPDTRTIAGSDRSTHAAGRTPGEPRGREPGAATRGARPGRPADAPGPRRRPGCLRGPGRALPAPAGRRPRPPGRPRRGGRGPDARTSSCGSTGPARGTGRGPSSRPGCSRSPTTWRSNHLRSKGRNPTRRRSAAAATSARSRSPPVERAARRPRGDPLGPDAPGRALRRRPRGARTSSARTRRWPSCSTSSRT